MIAKIIPKIKLPRGANSIFDYEIPKELESKIKIGQMVEVPFRNRKKVGLVLEILNPKSDPPAGGLNKFKIQNSKFQTKPILKILDEKPILYPQQIEVLNWIAEYYYVPLSLVLKMLVPDVPVTKARKHKSIKANRLNTNSILAVLKSRLPEIKKAIDEIIKSPQNVVFQWNDLREKITIYIKMVEYYSSLKKQVLIIVPQISDLEFLYGYLQPKFGAGLAILHSELNKVAQYASWCRIRQNRAKIILGTRSAVLAPMKNPGLIIVDDEESSDHKQSDMNPRYDSRRIVEMLGIKVMFASSAPRVETYEKLKSSASLDSNENKEITEIINAKDERSDTPSGARGVTELEEITTKIIPKVAMPSLGRSLGTETRKLGGEFLLVKLFKAPIFRVKMVDMKGELTRQHYSPISTGLEQAITNALQKNQKVLLFHSRKGTAAIVACKDCNHLFKCSHCNLPLPYHETEKQLICHHCGYRLEAPLACPVCQATGLKYIGTGTQKVESEIRQLFPLAKIIRIDKDTNYYRLNISDYDIIIGTQLFFKLFPSVDDLGLTGVVSADNLLYRPSFRSDEKTFGLLTKVLVWSRFNKVNTVVVQSYSPEHYSIWYALQSGDGGYEKFYEREIKARSQLGYPPFTKLIKLLYKHPNQEQVTREARRTALTLQKTSRVKVIGPLTPHVSRVRHRHLQEIILKTPLDSKLASDLIPSGWLVDVEPEEIM